MRHIARTCCVWLSLAFAAAGAGADTPVLKAAGLESGTVGDEGAPSDFMADKEALELVRSYYAIPETQRRRLFELARVLSDVA